MLRDGLFSSDEFLKAAAGFTLLRLKPGPAESEFGITAAPMAAVSDWHGRVVIPYLNLRGDIPAACRRLESVLKSFDRRKASKPPYEPPDWARPFTEVGGAEALGRFLETVHPRGRRKPARTPSFEDMVKVGDLLEVEGQVIRFGKNVIEAVSARAPDYGEDFPGRAEEAALLRKLTWARNDRIKFDAISGFASFAPVGEVGFLVERAKDRAKDCRNPNVVLCNCMSAIGVMAKRFPGASDASSARDRAALLAVLPALIEVLDTEARNNGACRLARDSVAEVVHSTGAPEALEAYLHGLKAPGDSSDWMKKMTDRFHAECVKWLQACTGQTIGADFDAWSAWYRKHRDSLFYHPGRKAFVVDGSAAKRFRKKLASLR